MSNYTKATNFTTKDSLPAGNALKIVKGTEFDIEFNAIATAVNSKADSSGVTSSLALKANTTDVNTALDLKAPLASPALTGTPTAPTAAVNNNTTQLATTAFVVAQVADDAPTKTGTGASGTWGISITGDAGGNAATVTTITTAQVAAAIGVAAFGDIGTTVIAWNATTTGVSSAGTIAGSNLRYRTAGAFNMFDAASASAQITPPPFPTANHTTLSGTWRNMGSYCSGSVTTGTGTGEDPFVVVWYPSLWMRTA